MLSITKLRFGVAPEDLLSSEDVCDGFKALLHRTIYFCYSDIPLDFIISFSGSLSERIVLKEQFARGRILAASTSPPGAPLWVIRHFLGLLPEPLLRNTQCSRSLVWTKIASKCRSTFASRNAEIVSHISKEIAGYLNELPAKNILITIVLVRLFRELSEMSPKNQFFKRNVLSLAKYYTQALFNRPYRPGHITDIDRRIYPLTAFFIIYWHKIEGYLKLLPRTGLTSSFEIDMTASNEKEPKIDLDQYIPERMVLDVATETDEISRSISMEDLPPIPKSTQTELLKGDSQEFLSQRSPQTNPFLIFPSAPSAPSEGSAPIKPFAYKTSDNIQISAQNVQINVCKCSICKDECAEENTDYTGLSIDRKINDSNNEEYIYDEIYKNNDGNLSPDHVYSVSGRAHFNDGQNSEQPFGWVVPPDKSSLSQEIMNFEETPNENLVSFEGEVVKSTDIGWILASKKNIDHQDYSNELKEASNIPGEIKTAAEEKDSASSTKYSKTSSRSSSNSSFKQLRNRIKSKVSLKHMFASRKIKSRVSLSDERQTRSKNIKYSKILTNNSF